MIDGESEGGHCDDAQDEVNQEKSENVARWVVAIYSISTQQCDWTNPQICMPCLTLRSNCRTSQWYCSNSKPCS